MKLNKHYIIGTLIICMLLLLLPTDETKAADSYTDPKTFFDTCKNRETHAEFTNGHIYYCTKGKTAGSTASKRFRTIGFQITASAGGYSMSIDVARGGSYLFDVAGDVLYSDGSTYNLYCISYETIAELMQGKDPDTWAAINNSSLVNFKIDAIMSVVPSGSSFPVGYVAYEGAGALMFGGDTSRIYYVGTPWGLSGIESEFGAGKFTYYKDINKFIQNPTLTVNLYAGETGVTSTKGYKIESSTNKIENYTLTGKRFGTITLPHPVTDLGLQKTGYKIKEKEWKNIYTRKLFFMRMAACDLRI